MEGCVEWESAAAAAVARERACGDDGVRSVVVVVVVVVGVVGAKVPSPSTKSDLNWNALLAPPALLLPLPPPPARRSEWVCGDEGCQSHGRVGKDAGGGGVWEGAKGNIKYLLVFFTSMMPEFGGWAIDRK